MTKKKSLMTSEEYLRVKAQCLALREKHRDAINAKQQQKRAPGVAARAAALAATAEQRADEKRVRLAAYKKAWREQNLVRIKAEKKANYQTNREASIAKSVAWGRANKDKRKVNCAKYSAANPDIARASKARRKARKNDAGGSVSKSDLQCILESQKWLCVVCRVKLDESYEADHIVPLALGGSSDKSNMQILCMPCNRSKGAKDPIDFMQQRGFLL